MADTICAISTPSGIGGIAIVRISGPNAIVACSRIFRPFKPSHSLESRKTHTLTFGHIIIPTSVNHSNLDKAITSQNEDILDEVVVSIYRAPHSFTGEDIVEISCHGSLYIQQRIIEILTTNKTTKNLPLIESELECFCRLASPGEFTRRAFAHGRFDLTQAEAVADLISAQSAASHRLAMHQMKGSISQKLTALHNQLLQLTALLELELDFSEEDVEFADRTRLINLTHEIDAEVTLLASTFQQGQAIKNGIPVAIIGAPNVGKSTLLNALLKEDRAIVSPIQGTTRDLIEDTITLGGYLFRFIDTAGIRHTSDTIEQLGIERSHQAANKAQIILMITEPGVDYPEVEVRPDQQVIHILNKIDLNTGISASTFDLPASNISISAKQDIGIDTIENALIDSVSMNDSQGEVILTNARHHEALIQAHEALQRVLSGLSTGLSNEFIAMDLQDVINALNQILGKEITSQDTLNQIFSNFCIGK